ncbi:hypothetical protein NQ318_010463 [Aromia moschata]|uniref:Uncharacterized protein n=1 Tax=Aromia moschata TaxID=1265417 RepID=A0AAV8Y9T5_9CUCU|nr:hypothetical protein NQ318_010463 [Aromia moschata]
MGQFSLLLHVELSWCERGVEQARSQFTNENVNMFTETNCIIVLCPALDFLAFTADLHYENCASNISYFWHALRGEVIKVRYNAKGEKK